MGAPHSEESSRRTSIDRSLALPCDLDSYEGTSSLYHPPPLRKPSAGQKWHISHPVERSHLATMPSIGISKRHSSSSSAPRLPSALLAKLPVRRKSDARSLSSTSSSGKLRLLSKTKAKTKKNASRSKFGDNSKVPKRKSTSIIISNATDGLNTELVVEPVISPVSVLSDNDATNTAAAATVASLVEDTTTTITSTGSVASAKQNDTQSKTNDEEMSAEYSAPPAPSFDSTVSNTPSFTINDDESSLVVIEEEEEEEVVEEVAVSQQSQESWIPSPNNSISTNVGASPAEVSSDSASDFADDPGEANALCEGTFVRVTSNGKYKGRVGIVSRMTEKMVYVTIEGIEKDPRIRKVYVEVVGEEQPSHAISTQRSTSTPPISTSPKTKNNTESESSTPFEVGQTITVINENSDYCGKKGTIIKVNNKMLRVLIDGVGAKSLSKKSVKILLTSTPKANQPRSISRTGRCPNDLQVEIPLGCDTGISSISLATGIITPKNNVQQIDTDVVIPSPQNSTRSSSSGSKSAKTLGQGAQLIIKAGKYKGKAAIFMETLPRSLKVAIDGQEVTVRKTSELTTECQNRSLQVIRQAPGDQLGRAVTLHWPPLEGLERIGRSQTVQEEERGLGAALFRKFASQRIV